MTKEYISRDEMIEQTKARIVLGAPRFNTGLETAIEVATSIPAADVAPVRHGWWIWELADNGWANHICSECGYTKNTDIHVRLGYDYCPICGAKMEGSVDG